MSVQIYTYLCHFLCPPFFLDSLTLPLRLFSSASNKYFRRFFKTVFKYKYSSFCFSGNDLILYLLFKGDLLTIKFYFDSCLSFSAQKILLGCSLAFIVAVENQALNIIILSFLLLFKNPLSCVFSMQFHYKVCSTELFLFLLFGLLYLLNLKICIFYKFYKLSMTFSNTTFSPFSLLSLSGILIRYIFCSLILVFMSLIFSLIFFISWCSVPHYMHYFRHNFLDTNSLFSHV